MAHPRSLVQGNCYFHVNFYDHDMLFPDISTLEFLRQGEDEKGARLWLFREPRSSDETPEQDASHDGESFIGFSDDQLYQILDFAGLSAVLGEVAMDHPLKSPCEEESPQRAPCTDFGDLSGQVETFLDNPSYEGVTMTIRFTDSGFSLGRRREGGLVMGFFPRPRREPSEESKIRRLFESLGIRPHVDYLADRGRTRALEFPVTDRPAGLIELCERVLRDVYDMKNGDTLKFKFLNSSGV